MFTTPFSSPSVIFDIFFFKRHFQIFCKYLIYSVTNKYWQYELMTFCITSHQCIQGPASASLLMPEHLSQVLLLLFSLFTLFLRSSWLPDPRALSSHEACYSKEPTIIQPSLLLALRMVRSSFQPGYCTDSHVKSTNPSAHFCLTFSLHTFSGSHHNWPPPTHTP